MLTTVQTVITGIVGIVCLIMLWFLWRIRVKKIYQFELIFMRAGVNDHVFVRGSELSFKHEYNAKEYDIASDRLYRVKPQIFTRFSFMLKGIKKRFIVVFQKGKKTPIKPIEVSVSSRVLNEVRKSRAIDKALKSEFAIPMDLKKIIIILGFIVVVIVSYLVVTGQVVF